MIRHLRGEYLYYDSGSIVIETAAGIGFRVSIPTASTLLNAREGDTIEVYTYMQVKDDGMSLYGFSDLEGLKLFELLITVNGVGPKAGLAIMSLGTPGRIKSSIAAKDAAAIAKAQGVGKKTAERVILELADKVSVTEIDASEYAQGSDVQISSAMSGERGEAVLALTTLGYTKKEAEDAISQVQGEDYNAEDYIKHALKYLM